MKNELGTARATYLASLDADEELTARRTAERCGIPDNDPMWLLLAEVRRACRATTECTTGLQTSVADAANRIERAARLNGDNLAERGGSIAVRQVADGGQITAALERAIGRVESEAGRTMQALQRTIRESIRRRAATPIASLLFAIAIGIATACGSIWTTCHVAIGYGKEMGYRAGYHDALLYGGKHR